MSGRANPRKGFHKTYRYPTLGATDDKAVRPIYLPFSWVNIIGDIQSYPSYTVVVDSWPCLVNLVRMPLGNMLGYV